MTSLKGILKRIFIQNNLLTYGARKTSFLKKNVWINYCCGKKINKSIRFFNVYLSL